MHAQPQGPVIGMEEGACFNPIFTYFGKLDFEEGTLQMTLHQQCKLLFWIYIPIFFMHYFVL